MLNFFYKLRRFASNLKLLFSLLFVAEIKQDVKGAYCVKLPSSLYLELSNYYRVQAEAYYFNCEDHQVEEHQAQLAQGIVPSPPIPLAELRPRKPCCQEKAKSHASM